MPTVVEPARPRAMTLAPAEVVRTLTAVLGSKVVAIIGGVKDTRSVRAWQREESPPTRIDALRLALRVADIIKTRDRDDVVRAWFGGTNQFLGGENPALFVANRYQYHTDQMKILDAARAFISE